MSIVFCCFSTVFYRVFLQADLFANLDFSLLFLVKYNKVKIKFK